MEQGGGGGSGVSGERENRFSRLALMIVSLELKT